MPFFQKIFGTSQDYHKSAIKFSKCFWPPPPPKFFPKITLKNCLRKDRKTERQKDRKTERQKDRKTERQKDRKTERQKDRKTERQKDRKTERQKDKCVLGKCSQEYFFSVNNYNLKFINENWKPSPLFI